MSTEAAPLDLAAAITKAMRLKGVTADPSPNGREARIRLDGQILAYVHRNRNGIRVHVKHPGREERLTVPTVTAAAAAVKRSERRKVAARSA